jgi:hypothetical protein
MPAIRLAAVVLAALVVSAPVSAQVTTPEQFFGFRMGTDGELAAYPKVLEYLQHLAATTDRVKVRELGRTTLDNPYVLATISSPQNLARMDRLVQITNRLADPRGLSDAEAAKLAAEGRPFYYLYATIHSTEMGNGQAIVEIAHELATQSTPRVREILDNAVLLLVPSQNPDGQVLLIDHWYRTKGTGYSRIYPDLYHKYVGHDNNRDWFMFTQKETRLSIERVHSVFKPQVTHDMHQTSPLGARIFVPPFDEPYDPNIHPILIRGMGQIGAAMAAALTGEGRKGVVSTERYDGWTPARQYMVYHGQPRILTEIASVSFADPFVNPAGAGVPLGSQQPRWNFPVPYDRPDWRLRDIVDYGKTAVYAGLSHLAKHRNEWLTSFHAVHRDWVNWKGSPYAFVLPAAQRDPFETMELLRILEIGEVEVHRAKASFSAGGQTYPEGSWVVLLAQPYGAFAKTMLERQVYPDLRLFPGGPPKQPYDVTGHTLGLLMGVDVVPVEQPFQASLEKVAKVEPPAAPAVTASSGVFLIDPDSNAGFIALSRLQAAGLPALRAAAGFSSGDQRHAAGTWIVPARTESQRILSEVSRETGLVVHAAAEAPAVAAFHIKPKTSIGLWKSAGNMPAGWLMWLFEQYAFNHQVIAANEVTSDLASRYDTIVLPSGTTKDRIVRGLDPKQHDEAWAWAYGIGDVGWKALGDWVRGGGTLVAIGSAVETARELLDLPIDRALPDSARRRNYIAEVAGEGGGASGADALKLAFQSPAQLMLTLRDRVVEPESLFYCPGSLLMNEFDPGHPVAFGMPEKWPVFFETDQAYRVRPGFGIESRVAARYPAEGPLLASGWLLGEEYLRDQANVVMFRVGKGTVVTLASQVDYRTQPRATFKLLFNAMFHGPSTRVEAGQMKKLLAASTDAEQE